MTRTHEILERLISHNTVSDRSNLALIDEVQAILTHCGARVTRLDDPDEPKAGLYAELGPAGPGGILLSSHSDVVPTDGQNWTKPAFSLSQEGERLYGRGATDMKGFLASTLALAERSASLSPRRPIKFVISYDEEVGCVGIARMLERLKPLVGTPDLAVVGEPTEMNVATGHKGKRAYRAVIRGEAGHSALAPQFVNALNVAADFVRRLEGLGNSLSRDGVKDQAYDVSHSTVHVGTLSGGRALNVVPDTAEMTFEFRHLAQDDPDDLEERIRALAAEAQQAYGPAARIEVRQISAYPGLDVQDQNIIDLLQGASGQGTCKVAFGTEAGFFDAMGLPTLVCGPGSMEGQGHKPDEFITVGQLAACDAMLDALTQKVLLD